jgi:hypothetical protein
MVHKLLICFLGEKARHGDSRLSKSYRSTEENVNRI